jgi:outer membrane protein OmpA-like peptidoglycan-associated protein
MDRDSSSRSLYGVFFVSSVMIACSNPIKPGVDVESLPPTAAVPSAPSAAPLRTPEARGAETVRRAEAASTTFIAPAPLPFADAVARAGQQLLRSARNELGNEPRTLVIDPLIDANTGGQTVDTVRMGKQLEAAAKAQTSGWSLKPLTRQSLADRPLLLIGTLTPINAEPAIDKQADAYRIWLTLIDTRTNRVVAKQLDRATVDSVNPEPLPYYRDSPSWHKDRTVAGYINSCQINTRIGDLADPDYVTRLPAAATVIDAIAAYNAGQYAQANKLYKDAVPLADHGDLRVLNGLYLTSWRLGQRQEAKEAFSKLVASGLELKKLPLKILFMPGQTTFMKINDLPEQYEIWLDALAAQATKVNACIRITGHTSRTGPASVNLPLSRRRADAIMRLLTQRSSALAAKLSPIGVGSREALSGLGTDDARDALDRRVEFRVADCV